MQSIDFRSNWSNFVISWFGKFLQYLNRSNFQNILWVLIYRLLLIDSYFSPYFIPLRFSHKYPDFSSPFLHLCWIMNNSFEMMIEMLKWRDQFIIFPRNYGFYYLGHYRLWLSSSTSSLYLKHRISMTLFPKLLLEVIQTWH